MSRATPTWLSRFKSLLPGVSRPLRRSSKAAAGLVSAGQPNAARGSTSFKQISIAGKEPGWLRVLEADDLIHLVQAQKAVRQMWHQSRLADAVFQRDLLPAIHRYAEYVQLMPASEAHHHAHAGGLLAHTLEMVLAAMTWRNGHFLPTNAPVEQIDAERDQWTYVVFFAALLHDIAKPMTDLRILWRGGTMNDPIRWKPIAGSLAEVGEGRPGMEYRVEFEPKAMRDYQAHSRLALTLLRQIAPSSALTFLARTPHAFDALSQYLSGNKVGLLADIIKRADQASTSNALLHGSKARFSTANSVPLVDLLMQALKAMLLSGAELPLNRSGAAGWVHDGSIWFVAKRLADTTRAWIKANAPEEAIPGEAKNDRLFDTWQEYGILQTNPQTGQAIWHVEVIGEKPQEEGVDSPDGEDAGHQYSHALSMLRFPLEKLYDDSNLFPPAMSGRIVVKAKRAESNGEQDTTSISEIAAGNGELDEADSASAAQLQSLQATDHVTGAPGSMHSKPKDAATLNTGAKTASKPRIPDFKAGIPAPKIGKPKLPQQSTTARVSQKNDAQSDLHEPGTQQAASVSNQTKTAAITAGQAIEHKPQPRRPVDPGKYKSDPVFPPLEDAIDGFGFDDDGFLDEVDSASFKQDKPTAARQKTPGQGARAALREPEMVGRTVVPTAAKTASIAAPRTPLAAPTANKNQRPKAASKSNHQEAAAMPTAAAQAPDAEQNKSPRSRSEKTPLVAIPPSSAGEVKTQRLFSRNPSCTTPVVLTASLPDLPHEVATKKKEPSATALEFMQWLQRGLANREIKYNETGAPVHFVDEGMALVSPLIFKLHARETGPEDEAAATGMQVQREVIKAGWHRMAAGSGGGKVNILRYQVIGRGNAVVAHLSAVVLVDPDRFVLPVPPANPVLKLES